VRRDLPRFAALGRFATASALALTLLGCEASSSGPSAPASTPPATDAAPPPMGGEAPPPAGGTTPAPAERAFESARANLRFKGAARLREEFARILQLPTDALCTELGQFDCIDDLHQITLGGVEPYQANIFKPFPGIAVGASLAVERVALSACTTRIERDAADPARAVYFGDIPLRGSALADVNAPQVDAALTALTREAWLREPTPDDLATLKALYADVLAEGGRTPAFTWAQLVCMTTLTASEALLY
jgi:hypothetical protein